MSPQLWTFLGTIGGTAILVSIGAIFVRRKTKAETADIITRAAGTVITQMEARLIALESEVAELRQLESELRRRETAFMRRITELEAEVIHLRSRLQE